MQFGGNTAMHLFPGKNMLYLYVLGSVSLFQFVLSMNANLLN